MYRICSKAFTTASQDVQFLHKQGVLAIQLHRQKALNALTQPMLLDIHHKLAETNPALVYLTGKGKAFCAGGDVKSMMTEEGRGNPTQEDIRVKFFRTEYMVDAAMSKGHGYRIISFLKGITMGGGYGLSSQNDLRISTSDSIFAMPENKLGLFPDVGAVRSLVHCPDNFGKYLALTGNIINGNQMRQYGIVDVLLDSKDDCQKLEVGMNQADPHILNKLGIWNKLRVPFQGQPTHPIIKTVFGFQKITDIIKQLEQSKDEFAVKTLKNLRQLCPYSVCVTNLMYERTKTMSYKDRLVQDFRLAVTCTHRADFNKGVKAVLVEKGKVAAEWEHKKIQDVSEDEVKAAFLPFKEKKIPLAEFDPKIKVDYY